jgi:hypothetical protein
LTLAVGGGIIIVVRLRSGVRVRLTEKQWEHIVAARPELGGFRREVLEAVEHPDAEALAFWALGGYLEESTKSGRKCLHDSLCC